MSTQSVARTLKGHLNELRLYAKSLITSSEFASGELKKMQKDWDKVTNAMSEMLVSIEEMERVVMSLIPEEKKKLTKEQKRELDNTKP